MTDLNIAYAYNGNDINDDDNDTNKINNDINNSYDDYDIPSINQSQKQQIPQKQDNNYQQQSQPISQPISQPQQQQLPNFQSYQPQQIQHFQQLQPSINKKQTQQMQHFQQRHPEYSFWDRMVLSKNDVLKLLLLSFVIVLGISIEKIGHHYISQYLIENILSSTQEFIVRISFPIFIFLLLWIIKSL